MVTHDRRGRAVERRVERDGFRPRTWRFKWDGQDQLVECVTPGGEVWRYGHDPFNRRVSKTRIVEAGAATSPPRMYETRFLWDGDLMIEEAPMRADGSLDVGAATRWHYEPTSFRPLARTGGGGELLYIVNDHLGTPREMLDEHGSVRWAAVLSVWGAVRRTFTAAATTQDDCPIRFRGQWADDETGLSYNRHRYYDAATASYLSPDPIGIFRGIRSHAYVSNPANRVDPFGLSVTYQDVDGLGRPTGATADIGVGDLRPSGTSTPPSSLIPPGWVTSGPPDYNQRSHLIGDTLGGSGSDRRNIVTLTDGSNHRAMSSNEAKIRKYLREHPNCRVQYKVTPNYNGNDLAPDSVTMHAVSSDGTDVVNTTVPNGLHQSRK